MIALTGPTCQVRKELREMGAQWDANGKRWYIEEDKADEARALVRDVGRPRANASRVKGGTL